MLVFNSRLIAFQSFDCDSLFSVIKEFGGNGAVGHEYADYDTPHTTQGTDDDELVAP